MTPRQARKLANTLHLLAVLASIAALPPAIYLILEIFYPTPPAPNPILHWQKTEPSAPAPSSEDSLRLIHESRITEDRPPAAPAPEPPPQATPPQPKPQPPALPYDLAGIMADADAKQSCAVLKDKRTGKQILVRTDATIPETTWKITHIQADRIDIDCNGTIITLAWEKPWEKLAGTASNTAAVADLNIKNEQQISPNDSEAHLSLGRVYMADHKTQDKALEHFQKVLILEPNHSKKQIIKLWIMQLQSQSSVGKKLTK